MSKKMNILFYIFLVLYILLMLESLLFKQVPILNLLDPFREIYRSVNLKPFKSIQMYAHFYSKWTALMNIGGNIVLFIPLGIYMQIFNPGRKIFNGVMMVFGISLLVEIVQYVFGLGITDIDDLILNTLGGLMGILFYKSLYLFIKNELQTQNIVTVMFCVLSVIAVIGYAMLTFFGYRIRIF